MMIFKKSVPLMVMLMLMVPASFAAAHSGHDHGHWTSPAVHTFFWLALASSTALGAWFYRRDSKNVKTETKEK
jgi:hypothetical protein